MQIRRYKDIIAVQERPDQVWGFHAHNLEVAELTPQIWNSLASPATLAQQPELQAELEVWQKENSPETQDAQLEGPYSDSHIQKLSLNIAQVCNLKCTYCAAGGDGTYGSKTPTLNLSLAQQQIAHFLAKTSARQFRIQLIGGEPLLYPQVVRELCEYAQLCVAGREVELHFSTTTNGTRIDADVAKLLAHFHFAVTISLDGDADINNRSRPLKGREQTRSSTEQTLDGICELQKVRRELRSLNVNSVFGAHNIEVLKTYNFLTSQALEWDEISLLYSNNEKDESLTPIYINEMRKVAELAYTNYGIAGLAQIKQFRSTLSRLAAQTRLHSYCGAGKSLLQVDTRGDLYTCNWFMTDSEEKIGFGTTINSSKLQAYEKSFIELNNCQSCWARHLCAGGCLAIHKAKTGHRHKKDPLFCERTRALAATAIGFYAKTVNENLNLPTSNDEEKQNEKY